MHGRRAPVKGGTPFPPHIPEVADPGNLIDVIDAEALARIAPRHRALGGGTHVTPEDLTRLEADDTVAELARGAKP